MSKDKLKILISSVIAVCLVVIATIQYNNYKDRKEEEIEKQIFIILAKNKNITTHEEELKLYKQIRKKLYQIPKYKRKLEKIKNKEKLFYETDNIIINILDDLKYKKIF